MVILERRAASGRVSRLASPSRLWFLLGACLFLLMSSDVQAETIGYANVNGADVFFQNIQESSVTDPLPLFGAPTGSGNQLLFSPQGFASSSENLSADTTDGQLSMNIVVNPAKATGISHVRINEAGDYSLTAAQAGLSATASVATPVFVRINNDMNLTFSTSMTFSPNGGSYSLPANATAGTAWTGSLDVDIAAYLLSKSYAGPATQIYLTLDNTLNTASTLGASASIAKKMLGMDITVTTVPEPGTMALLGCGGFFLAFFGLRRRSA